MAGILLALIRYMKLQLRAEYCYTPIEKKFRITCCYKKHMDLSCEGQQKLVLGRKKPLHLGSQAMLLPLPQDKWEVIQGAQPDKASALQVQILFHACVAPQDIMELSGSLQHRGSDLPRRKMPGFLWFCGFKQKTKIQVPSFLSTTTMPHSLPSPPSAAGDKTTGICGLAFPSLKAVLQQEYWLMAGRGYGESCTQI